MLKLIKLFKISTHRIKRGKLFQMEKLLKIFTNIAKFENILVYFVIFENSP